MQKILFNIQMAGSVIYSLYGFFFLTYGLTHLLKYKKEIEKDYHFMKIAAITNIGFIPAIIALIAKFWTLFTWNKIVAMFNILVFVIELFFAITFAVACIKVVDKMNAKAVSATTDDIAN